MKFHYARFETCYADPSYSGTSRPRNAVGRDGIQAWRVDANVMNKQSRKTDKGWSSNFGVGRGVNNTSPLLNVTQGLWIGEPL